MEEESITKGRHGFMPAFDDKLKPEEIKAVSVYVFWRAEVSPVRPDTAEASRRTNPAPNNPKAMPRQNVPQRSRQ